MTLRRFQLAVAEPWSQRADTNASSPLAPESAQVRSSNMNGLVVAVSAGRPCPNAAVSRLPQHRPGLANQVV